MSIAVNCPCGKKIKVKDEFSGKHVRCPDCGESLLIPNVEPGDEVPSPDSGGVAPNLSGRKSMPDHSPKVDVPAARPASRSSGKALLFGSLGAAAVLAASLVYCFFVLPGSSPNPAGHDQADLSSGDELGKIARIEAVPNPVPLGPGLGKTTIRWNTGDGSSGDIWVAEPDQPESPFEGGPSGSKEAPWIQAGHTYVFRLYAGKEHRTILASVKVSRRNPSVIKAVPNPVPPGSEPGKTMITWDTGDDTQGKVYVSEDGGKESEFATGVSDSQEATWIRPGSTYEFRLYTSAPPKKLLASVKVTR
jgi:hypothetical protein